MQETKEQKDYAVLSRQLKDILGQPKKVIPTSIKPKDLSFLTKLGGFPKSKVEKEKIKPSKNLPEVVLVDKQFITETPEELLTKLLSIPNILEILGIPKVKDIVEEIKNLKGNDRIDISHLRNGEHLSRIAQRVDMNDMRWHGAGIGIDSFTVYDLSTQLNGVLKTFTIPTNKLIYDVRTSSAPFVYRPTIDYTGTGTTTLAFTAQIDPTISLASGQTLLVLLI